MGSDYVWENPPLDKVDLSATIPANILEELTELSSEYYFVGGSVRALIKHEALQPKQDIDVVMQPKPGALEKFGYKKSKFIPKLYIKNTSVLIDCYVPFESLSPYEQMIEKDFFSRDFTIGCLFCDAQGQLYDPTGMGLQDLKDQKLRTIKPAQICFSEDPVRVLRAIHYCAIGYTPTLDLELALRSWQKNIQIFNQNHMYAVARSMILKIDDPKRIIALLLKYNLLDKLFDIQHDNMSEDEQLEQLKNKISLPSYSHSGSMHQSTQRPISAPSESWPLLSSLPEDATMPQSFTEHSHAYNVATPAPSYMPMMHQSVSQYHQAYNMTIPAPSYMPMMHQSVSQYHQAYNMTTPVPSYMLMMPQSVSQHHQAYNMTTPVPSHVLMMPQSVSRHHQIRRETYHRSSNMLFFSPQNNQTMSGQHLQDVANRNLYGA